MITICDPNDTFHPFLIYIQRMKKYWNRWNRYEYLYNIPVEEDCKLNSFLLVRFVVGVYVHRLSSWNSMVEAISGPHRDPTIVNVHWGVLDNRFYPRAIGFPFGLKSFRLKALNDASGTCFLSYSDRRSGQREIGLPVFFFSFRR